MRRSGADESEWCTDVNANNDVPGVIGRGVQHAVVREARVVHDVVDLAELPAHGRGPQSAFGVPIATSALREASR